MPAPDRTTAALRSPPRRRRDPSAPPRRSRGLAAAAFGSLHRGRGRASGARRGGDRGDRGRLPTSPQHRTARAARRSGRAADWRPSDRRRSPLVLPDHPEGQGDAAALQKLASDETKDGRAILSIDGRIPTHMLEPTPPEGVRGIPFLQPEAEDEARLRRSTSWSLHGPAFAASTGRRLDGRDHRAGTGQASHVGQRVTGGSPRRASSRSRVRIGGRPMGLGSGDGGRRRPAAGRRHGHHTLGFL